MPVINILSPHVADMIAAGEVVERPASVIKELMENSFDAGAKNITVEIKAGGATYIRVTDDGCGMAPEDAGVAFLRHATSKLSSEQDLEAIGTMGFRGEALAAISAVSRIELLTRRAGDEAGTRVTLEAGEIQEMTPCGCPVGTTMTVRDIFFNTPARLKFLKSDRSEASACVAAALRCALGRPEVSVRFIKDGEDEFFSPGDTRADSAVYSLLGREIASSLLQAKGEDESMRVSGFVSSPSAGRGSRSAQYFYCNGRYIRSPMLQTAVEQAYKNTLLTGRFPACVLYLDIDLSGVDVNVHPAKTEIKFSYERRVFDLVYNAALSALTNESRTASVTLSPATKRLADQAQGQAKEQGFARFTPQTVHGAAPKPYAAQPAPAAVTAREDFYKSMSAEEFRRSAYSGGTGAVKVAGYDTDNKPKRADSEYTFPAGVTVLRTPEESYQTRLDLSPKPVYEQKSDIGGNKTEELPKSTAQNVENSVQNVETAELPEYKIVGEALKTYIIIEVGGELILIDKHAAHERMIFDRLKANQGEIMSQQLLTPVPLRLDGESAELVEQNGDLLTELGFEIEAFGRESYILRAVPADMPASEAAAAFEEICEKLRRGQALSPTDARDEVLHTVACKAAIKAGWDTDTKELSRVAEEVLSGRIKYCPHGRPVSVTVTRRELDKLFKRIV